MSLNKIKLFLTLFHLVLGVAMVFGAISKVVSILVLLVGIIHIIKTKNAQNEAAFWAAYMTGSEVLFRMSGGMVFYELPKYSVLLFLLLGLYVERQRHHVSVTYFIYILLLLIGIAFMDIPFSESIRKAIAFNLSGPFLVGISAIYFYNRKIAMNNLLNFLFVMVLPIISMLSLLYLKTPDIESIRFSSNANFTTSGGYGPNQVATILGFGVFIFLLHLLFKKRIFSLFILDVFFFMYFIYRGLLTFSRGGMLTALLAILVFSFFYLLASKDVLKQFVKYIGILLFFSISLWGYTTFKTGGMLTNRYMNKNALGIEKKDISTGRIELFKGEFEVFLNNPFFGLGVGGGKYHRFETTNVLSASHNEVSRLLGEHGMIGAILLLMLLAAPVYHILQQPLLARGILGSFLVFWFLTINHSAMRIAFPAFIYGLSLMVIDFKQEREEITTKKKSN